MKRFAALALALAAAAAAAQTGEPAFEPAGRRGSYDAYVVRDASGPELTVLAEGPLSDEQKRALLGLRERALGLRLLRVRSARALVARSQIDLLVVPEAFAVDGQDLKPFLPAGIGFRFDGAFAYDFRMLVGHYFLRMSGPFEGEETLGRRLLEAVRTPAAFLKAETAGYLSDRFAALEERLHDVDSRGAEAVRDLGARIDGLQQAGTAALRDLESRGTEALRNLESRGIAALADLEARQGAALAELETRGAAALREVEADRRDLAALKGETAALWGEMRGVKEEQKSLRADQAAARADLEAARAALAALPVGRLEADVRALQRGLGSLAEDAEALRTAIVVLQSRGGNFAKRGIDREAVTRLAAMKRANPALTQSEAAAALKAQGLSMSSKEIGVVFGIFFGEYR